MRSQALSYVLTATVAVTLTACGASGLLPDSDHSGSSQKAQTLDPLRLRASVQQRHPGAPSEYHPNLLAISVEPSSVTVPDGQPQDFHALGRFDDGTVLDVSAQVQWASSDERIATVSQDGRALSLGEGPASISAHLDGLDAIAVLTVSAAEMRVVVIDPYGVVLQPKAERMLAASGIYTNGKRVDLTGSAVWTSSDAGVALAGVTAGQVVGVAPGRADVSASVGPLRATVPVFVAVPQLLSIAVGPDAVLAPGGSQQLSAIGTYADGSTVDLSPQAQWSSSDAQVASVGTAGLVSGVAAGNAIITAAVGEVKGIAHAYVQGP